jgi:hypothetical protein
MNKLLSVLVASLLLVGPAGAAEWQAVGPRAMGMGGAGVAEVSGPLASYWNPAALARATENSYGLAVPLGVHVALTGTVIEGAKNLKDLKDNTSTATDAKVQDALNKLNDPTNGLRVNANVGGNFKVGKLAFFLHGFSDIGATPVVDTVHNTAANIAANLNTSKLVVKGANVMEFGAGYGHELPFAPGVSLGGNLKIMKAQVGYADYVILQNGTQQDDITKKLKEGAATSGSLGVDLGALWDVDHTFDGARFHPRVGLTARNINNPKFKLPASAIAAGYVGKYSVNPQVRLGGSISPFNWWHIASDIDLTNNLTTIGDISSRQFGLGTEVDVFNRSWINIPLRFGIARNLADTNAGTMLTGGAGLNFLHVILDASLQVSPQTISTQSQGKTTKVPREVAVGLQLSILFGGSEDKPSRAGDVQPVPVSKAMAPAEPASKELPPAQADQVRQNAEKAQQDLNKQAAPPAPAAH